MAQVRAQSIGELKDIALAFAKSGFFEDSKEAAQVFTKMIAGSEWGLGPMAAMTGIFIVKNRPTMSATTIAGVIKKSGVYDFRRSWITRKEDKTLAIVTDELNEKVIGCRVSFYQDGDHLGDSVFTDVDAANAGLTSNPTYQKFPRNMYFSRALTNGARWHCPDVFGGAIYTPDEVEEAVELDATGQPTNYVEPKPQEGVLAIAADAPRVPKTLAQIKEMFELALPGLPAPGNGEPLKLGVWLEASGVAPELSQRIDAVTGRRLGLTAAEALDAEDRLLAVHQKIKDTFNGTAPAEPAEGEVIPPATAAAPTLPLDPDDIPETTYEADPFPPEGERTTGSITLAQNQRIQAMFGERKEALKRMFPDASSIDKRRHAFACRVLDDETKGSSKTWDSIDYKRVSDALEAIPPDAA
jgi:hypothetical protein